MKASTIFNSGARPPKAITNFWSGGGAIVTGMGVAFSSMLMKSVLCGSVTAGNLVTVLNITGRGGVKFLAAHSLNTTLRTIHLKVTVDGTVVFDATTNNTNAAYQGLFAIGRYQNSTVILEDYPFNSSLKVEVASSLTESNLINVGYQYYTT